ncbi:LPS export ABC transporter periplasmic protein LptC [Frateuria sp. STR12]|uniref:LPS export ABC transporter periplasmic protein LptC n=1 Tax=Frateuria hangzhouensis TaxID=2995589 RepID=UPI002260E427|nr:LPS export ABC transporter periplasmic protein LptC [Frateuria sp. STR12]MCX7514033.1 LPS export ABC transporter periplasmic protein LptC [Frateuria sp. STR12]
MAVREWLRDRRLAAAIVVVALLAGAAQLLFWWIGPAPTANQIVGPPRSGYTLTDFKLTQYGIDGLPSFLIDAPRLERREGDASLYINAPQFRLPSNQPAVPDWRGHSLYGWVNHNGSLLKLQGPVHMERAAFDDTASTTIDTADVTAWPEQNRLQTAAPAQMVQGGTRIQGIGMRADLNDKHLELLDDVHATFPPRQHAR